MFRYKSLEWHTSYIGSKLHGPASVGVNFGLKKTGFNVANDPVLDLQLASTSNVGVPGLFVYSLNSS